MKDFNYCAPTEVMFGEPSEEQVARQVKHYGGKSAVGSGLLDKVCVLLDRDGVDYVNLGWVVPNCRMAR